jgi:KipI family sensor histidine kinase inhibitor
LPLGDRALLVRFGEVLDDAANCAALALAAKLEDAPIAGVVEVVPSLISVLLRYDPVTIDRHRLSGEIGLRLTGATQTASARTYRLGVRFGGEAGPDLAEVAAALQLPESEFVARHCRQPLRVLTTGFAPGFVYCGFHTKALTVPRRMQVRPVVPAGSVLFAAGQTAIAATEVPTGWHVIGRTDFRNFDPTRSPPTTLAAGDRVQFEAV